MTQAMINAEEFFATARERYLIKLRRDAGQERPWTTDPYFGEWRFCNVHREDDKTSVWFRDNVRSKLHGIDVVRATLIFRWFNRISTGEAIKDLLLGTWNSDEAGDRLKDANHIVTGAYMIRSPEGMNKLDGVLYCIDQALPQLYSITSTTLKGFWSELLDIYCMGPFLAYEVVTDLRWTDVLKDAPDINTWANAGPGCAKGLGRVVSGNRKHFDRHNDQDEMLPLMVQLLKMSREERNWPQDWPKWELREVEHWLCEFEKWNAARDGKRLKRRYPCA